MPANLLVDLPPISQQHVEPWVFDLVRAADVVWLVLDGATALEGLDEVHALLKAYDRERLPVAD